MKVVAVQDGPELGDAVHVGVRGHGAVEVHGVGRVQDEGLADVGGDVALRP